MYIHIHMYIYICIYIYAYVDTVGHIGDGHVHSDPYVGS